jgi:hypothetical protein
VTILVILYVEMRLQMPRKWSKLKFCVNIFVNIFQHYSCHKVREHHDYNVNNYQTSFKTMLCILVIFCVEMRLQMTENFNKKTEQV